MRQFSIATAVAVTALSAIMVLCDVTPSHAQGRPGGRDGQGGGQQDEDKDAAKRRKRDEEWGNQLSPLPGMRNAGPCPYVKVLYDASRMVEFKDNREASNAVIYSGEIQGISAGCKYRGTDPIELRVEVLFALGRGPEAAPLSQSASRDFTYWVAVTNRNKTVLAKEYFTVPARFAAGEDRALYTDKLDSIVIPRAGEGVSGANFEVLIGFDVTPQMAEFNRDGKRFRVNVAPQKAP
jgi:hypothetical protein